MKKWFQGLRVALKESRFASLIIGIGLTDLGFLACIVFSAVTPFRDQVFKEQGQEALNRFDNWIAGVAFLAVLAVAAAIPAKRIFTILGAVIGVPVVIIILRIGSFFMH